MNDEPRRVTTPIRTERLLLRFLEESDLDGLLDYHGDPEVARYLLGEPWTRAHAVESLTKQLPRRGIGGQDPALALGIELDGRLIGDLSLWPVDDTLSRGEVGWVLHPTYGGHGYATEAVRALLDIAFGTYGMHRVRAQLDARNTASVRMCERLGMVLEAHLRQDWWSKGEWTDSLIYGLLAAEWRRGVGPA